MSGFVLSFQLTALGISLSATAPDADTAVAVAVGLVRAGRPGIEVPVGVEVARTVPAKAEPQERSGERIEWIRICAENGCRLVPRIASPDGTAPRPTQGASAAPSTPAGASARSCGEGCCCQGKRRFFRKRW